MDGFSRWGPFWLGSGSINQINQMVDDDGNLAADV